VLGIDDLNVECLDVACDHRTFALLFRLSSASPVVKREHHALRLKQISTTFSWKPEIVRES